MKTIEYTSYGAPEVLHLTERPKPVAGDNEILVKINATAVNYGDLAARNFKAISPAQFNMPLLFWLIAKFTFGLQKPSNPVLGSEFSGLVESVGKNVTQFKPGDAVFGYFGQNMGAYAQYVCVPQDGCVTRKPANLSDAEAACASYGAVMAINLLQKAAIQPGQKVLIIGASGSIGAAAVQLARFAGASVSGVCGAQRLEYVKSLGAEKVFDYAREDFSQDGAAYDLIFDVLGKTSFAQVKKSLKPGGLYLLASFKLKQLLLMLRSSFGMKPRVMCAIAPGSREDLIAVRDLIEAGVLKSPVDKQFPMQQAAEAHRYAESGLKQGNIVINIGG
ncbi:MAG: NAD(P)-dependent alcohol dehydrogenase [Anaerolineae bacterium]|nr:NAD(P)-dependent alcohol dehydrogenase [Anaerolineae bacterium]